MTAETVPPAGELLAKDVAELEARWQELSEEDLLKEIESYKNAINNVSTKLSALGEERNLTSAPVATDPV